MDSHIRDHLATTQFAEYQLLRNELMDILDDDALAFRPGGTAASLGELCREIGDVQHSYVQALQTFRQDFGWRNPDASVERDIASLTAWYADLDRELEAAIEMLSADDITGRRIVRHDVDVEGFWPLPPQELDIYREALLIFYGKASVYLRVMGKDLPGHWQYWIG